MGAWKGTNPIPPLQVLSTSTPAFESTQGALIPWRKETDWDSGDGTEKAAMADRGLQKQGDGSGAWQLGWWKGVAHQLLDYWWGGGRGSWDTEPPLSLQGRDPQLCPGKA